MIYLLACMYVGVMCLSVHMCLFLHALCVIEALLVMKSQLFFTVELTTLNDISGNLMTSQVTCYLCEYSWYRFKYFIHSVVMLGEMHCAGCNIFHPFVFLQVIDHYLSILVLQQLYLLYYLFSFF